MTSITDDLRLRLRDAQADGQSVNGLARRCGVHGVTLHHFVSGRDVNSRVVDKLASYFKLQLAAEEVTECETEQPVRESNR